MRALEIITGHLIYNPAYTYNFQLKTPKVLSIEPMAKTIDSLGQLQNMKNMKIYLVKNSFVDDVISDIESLKEMESLGYELSDISLQLDVNFVF